MNFCWFSKWATDAALVHLRLKSLFSITEPNILKIHGRATLSGSKLKIAPNMLKFNHIKAWTSKGRTNFKEILSNLDKADRYNQTDIRRWIRGLLQSIFRHVGTGLDDNDHQLENWKLIRIHFKNCKVDKNSGIVTFLLSKMYRMRPFLLVLCCYWGLSKTILAIMSRKLGY